MNITTPNFICKKAEPLNNYFQATKFGVILNNFMKNKISQSLEDRFPREE